MFLIRFNNNGNIFQYRGEIIEEESSFILIDEVKEGRIRLNKNNILSMKEVDSNDIR